MKEQRFISKEKFLALEEGSNCDGEKPARKTSERIGSCKQLIQCVKLILYIELTLFVGWACYMLWQPYLPQQTEFKAPDLNRGPQPQSMSREDAMQRAETVQSNLPAESEHILTKLNDPPREELGSESAQQTNRKTFPHDVPPVSSTSETPTLEASTSDDVTSRVNSASELISPTEITEGTEGDVSESKVARREEETVTAWSLPLLWLIHGLQNNPATERDDVQDAQLHNSFETAKTPMEGHGPATSEESKLSESNERETFNGETSISEDKSSTSERVINEDEDEYNDKHRRFEHFMESDAEVPDKSFRESSEDSWDRMFSPVGLPKFSNKANDYEPQSFFESEEERDLKSLPSWLNVPSSFGGMEKPEQQSDLSWLTNGNLKQGIPTSIPTGRKSEGNHDENDEPNSTSNDANLGTSGTLSCTYKITESSIVKRCELINAPSTTELFFSEILPRLQNSRRGSDNAWRPSSDYSENTQDHTYDDTYKEESQCRMFSDYFLDQIEATSKETTSELLDKEEASVVTEISNTEVDGDDQRQFNDDSQQEKTFIEQEDRTHESTESVQSDFDVRDPPDETVADKPICEDYDPNYEELEELGLQDYTWITDICRFCSEKELYEKWVKTEFPLCRLKGGSLFVDNGGREYFFDHRAKTMHRIPRSIDSNRRDEEREPLQWQKLTQFKSSEQETVRNNLNDFYMKMEKLKDHIDRLHEHFLLQNTLNDDYISREFPAASVEA